MKIDTSLLVSDLSDMPGLTQAAEAMGFDGIWTSETAHDPFLPLTLAAEHSQRISLGTSIAVAFPRSPAILAYIAWDLAKYSQGSRVIWPGGGLPPLIIPMSIPPIGVLESPGGLVLSLQP